MSKPSVVTKYLDKLEHLFIEHKLLQRIQELVLQFENNTTNDYTQPIIQFNQLDEENTRYTHAAESYCNWSLPHGAYE